MHKPNSGLPKSGRREDILATATALFSQHGVQAVTTRQIAARVGISQPSLYAHFASIQEIQDEVSTRAFALLEARFAVSAEAAPQEQLRQAVASYFDFGLTHPEAYRIAFLLEHPKAPQKADEDWNAAAFAALDHPGPRTLGHLRRIIARLRPDLDAAGQDRLTQCVWAALHGLIALLITRPDFPWADRDSLIAEHSRLVCLMVTSHVA
ncbi:TetR family transcriptional regulator [bacterium]|nr:TetR family transcriptional regulator [bacterium]